MPVGQRVGIDTSIKGRIAQIIRDKVKISEMDVQAAKRILVEAIRNSIEESKLVGLPDSIRITNSIIKDKQVTELIDLL
jgi:hypothetical protein